jgi:HlyD family secretion protein
VAAGTEILRIEQDAVAAELAAAESERLAAEESLRAARDELAIAARRFATDEKLYRENALTRDRHAESAAARDAAAARLAALEREVPLRVAGLELRTQELSSKLAAAVVVAPFSGTIYRTAAEKGQFVRVGDPILWIADLERLRVRANIDQVDLGRVRPGQSVLVASNAFPDRTWRGSVSEVIPHVFFRENRSISEGLAELGPPTDGLVPGMTVDVEIVVSEAADALQVPAEAVFTRENESFVYRVARGRLRRSAVRIGLTSERAVQIVEGVAAGDRVVIGPKQNLRDGMKVRVNERDGTAPPS